jgi:hypothetical protein
VHLWDWSYLCVVCRDESGTDIIRPIDRPKGSDTQMVWPYPNPDINIRKYPYCISIRKFKVEFLWSKYDEYHYSTQNILSVSKPIREFKPRKKNYLYLYPQYPFVSDPFSSLVVCLWIGHGCKFANVVWGWLFEAVTCVDVPVLCYWFTIEMFHCRYLMIPNLFPRPTFPFPVKNTWAGMVNVFSQLFLTTFIPNNSLLTRTKTKTQDLPILVKKYRRGE